METIFREVARCSFCGFCEHSCPTLKRSIRHYGPRGRVQTILFALKYDILTEKSIEAIYTCLVCNACSIHCPGKIRIASVVREFRKALRDGKIKKGDKILEEVM